MLNQESEMMKEVTDAMRVLCAFFETVNNKENPEDDGNPKVKMISSATTLDGKETFHEVTIARLDKAEVLEIAEHTNKGMFKMGEKALLDRSEDLLKQFGRKTKISEKPDEDLNQDFIS